MERLRRQSTGIKTDGLRKWGMVFLALGALGRSVLQNGILGMNEATSQELLDLLMNSSNAMAMATVALVLQFVEACATPLFCYLLVEGFQHTLDFKGYLIRVAAVALISEIPYNLAMSGELFDLSSRNPVFGMVLCLVLLYLYSRYAERSFVNVLIKLCVTVAAVIWAVMLNIEAGICCVIIVAALWLSRRKPAFRNIMGCTATIVCTLFSMYYLAAPMSFLIIHFYNGEKGEGNRTVNYLLYPVILLVIGVAGLILF